MEKTNEGSGLIKLILSVIFAVIVYGAIIYCSVNVANLFEIEKAGVFGDSFGLLTSLFSGLTFAGLYVTIQMQQKELNLQRQDLLDTREGLKDQRDEMRLQNKNLMVQRFENTFFRVLDLFISSRDNIQYRYKGGQFDSGYAAMRNMYMHLVNEYFMETKTNPSGIQELIPCINIRDIDVVRVKYLDFYNVAGTELGQYFRTLYNLLGLIESESCITEKEKTVYAKLVRAQLSRYELVMLFYNCISDLGNKRMAELVLKYNLLKHLEKRELPEWHSHLYPQS
ncbi:putative phage abortive infection protein [bacterium]|nr:putative phage abortive infection protein [bacterium]